MAVAASTPPGGGRGRERANRRIVGLAVRQLERGVVVKVGNVIFELWEEHRAQERAFRTQAGRRARLRGRDISRPTKPLAPPSVVPAHQPSTHSQYLGGTERLNVRAAIISGVIQRPCACGAALTADWVFSRFRGAPNTPKEDLEEVECLIIECCRCHSFRRVEGELAEQLRLSERQMKLHPGGGNTSPRSRRHLVLIEGGEEE